MARGPKPIPTALKLLRGNPGKRALPKGEPRPLPGLPEPPEHLSALALVEWGRVGTILAQMGVVTQADRAVLGAYCDLYAQWVEARQGLARTGLLVDGMMGGEIASPYIRIVHQTLDRLLKCMAELGLTPSSRVKLAKGEVSADDPLEQFLKNGKRKERQS